MWARQGGLASVLALPLLQQAAAQAMGEPSGNQVLFGAWVDTSEAGGSDTPQILNERLGQSFSIFQLSQDMPYVPFDVNTGVGGDPPEYLIEQSETDAAIFLTVYPTDLDLTDDDWTHLTDQIDQYVNEKKRTVFLRFAPEMQGVWNPAYGFQPVAYKQLWATMYQKVKAAVPECIVVWAPNLGTGYPYSQEQPTNQTELAELDTNNDGVVDGLDDPFGPYYPGDDQVDWNGISVYWKGPNYQNVNEPNPEGYCEMILNGWDPSANEQSEHMFYPTYCEGKPDKACMFAEGGSAYHVDISGGTNLAMQQAWWEACITNDTLYDTFPRLKLNMHFEYEKVEDDDLRDFRLANDSAIASAFSQELESFSTRVAWADFRALPSEVPSTGVPSTAVPTETTSVCTKYCGQVHFTTDRNPETGAPSLFGSTRASSAARLQATAAVGATTLAMVSAGLWLSGRSQRNLQRAPVSL